MEWDDCQFKSVLDNVDILCTVIHYGHGGWGWTIEKGVEFWETNEGWFKTREEAKESAEGRVRGLLLDELRAMSGDVP